PPPLFLSLHQYPNAPAPLIGAHHDAPLLHRDPRPLANGHRRAIPQHLDFFAFQMHHDAYSVFAISLAWVMALCRVCQASVAHFTRAGNSRTPDSTSSLPKSRSGCDSVSMACMSLNNCSTSSTGMPFTASVMSDAEAVEMAQPWPIKLTSSTTPSVTRTYTVS